MKTGKKMGKQDSLNIDLTDNRNVYQNTAQDYIVITKDKLELVLLKTEKSLSAKNSWITPLSLAITCGISLISSNFKDFILSASVWEAIFIISTFIFVFWLLKTALKAWHYRKAGNIQNIINQIISESKTQ
ncbi:MAG: hypothetical protein IKH59_05005 [Bacteroidaceae bacterium]|nr:hypothetical protein [Bacteroidaceae bacterium]